MLPIQITGDGPTIVFVHGFTLDHRMWRPQVEALASRFRCVTYDRRGHGRAPLPDGPYRHFDDLASVCGDDPVHVVGHSIGALYAVELALTRPVASLTLVDLSGLSTVAPEPEITAMFASLRAAAATDLDAARRIWAGCGYFRAARANPDVAAALDQMLADYSGWHWRHDDPVGNLAPPASGRLEELRARTLVIVGERGMPYHRHVADQLERRVAGARVVRLPAGHMVSMEAPTEVSAAIAAHVAA